MLLLLLLIGAVVGYDGSVNYWQAFAPGKLLQRLDALTLDDDASALTSTPPSSSSPLVVAAQPKLDEAAADDDDDVEVEGEDEEATELDDNVDDDIEAHDVDSTEGLSGEDYERNYEQFVRQYFDRVEQDDDNDDDGDGDEDHVEEHEATLDDSIETQAEASNVQRQQKPKEKCRRVRRQDQLCTICREPRNNEVSETCSYSHEAQPEQYAYGSGSQYKRYRDKQPVEKRHTTIVQPADTGSSSSLCVRRLLGKSICYECKDSGGKRMNRCYDAASSKKRTSSKPRGRQSEQEQRIYKRTISYSYSQDEQHPDPDPIRSSITPPIPVVTASPSPSPASVGRRLTKLLRRRTPILPRIAEQ
ncbi:myelin transcription factor 1-like protein [Drosophila albomicans]|uniref:Myelin transcription factor 1-like protein n=1 Tax=Drosophila albomicans TaxID=7291 RepID=A0A6P8XXU0_DROAB|nr:myelin transcription factor 1-like protein [Drosophila albomicans]